MTLSTYDTAKAFFGDKTVVALISYSTKGSAKSEEMDLIIFLLPNNNALSFHRPNTAAGKVPPKHSSVGQVGLNFCFRD